MRMAPTRRNTEGNRPHNQNQLAPSRPPSASSNSSSLILHPPPSTSSATPQSRPSSSSSVLEYESETKSEKKEIVWKLKDISTLIELRQISTPNPSSGFVDLDSIVFTAGDTVEMFSGWKLVLKYGKKPATTSINGAGATGTATPPDDDGFVICLSMSDCKVKSDNVFAAWTVTLKSPNGNVYRSWNCSMRDWKPFPRRCGSYTLPTPEVLRNSKVMVNDSFTIYVDFTICMIKRVLTTSFSTVEKFAQADKRVTDEFVRMLLEDGICSDFTIKIPKPGGKRGENEIFKVHKGILAARCSLFKTMFERQIQAGEITITDVTPIVMKALLKFIYTGILNDEWILIPEEVILAADKYQLTTMKEACEKNFGRVLTPSNALKMLKLSNVLNLQKGSKVVLDYVKSHLPQIVNQI